MSYKSNNGIENRVYKRICDKYDEFQQHHKRCINTCIALLILVPLVFVALMIGLETKLEFMVLWIVSILAIIAVIIYIEYRDYWYKQMLELDENEEDEEIDKEEEE